MPTFASYEELKKEFSQEEKANSFRKWLGETQRQLFGVVCAARRHQKTKFSYFFSEVKKFSKQHQVPSLGQMGEKEIRDFLRQLSGLGFCVYHSGQRVGTYVTWKYSTDSMRAFISQFDEHKGPVDAMGAVQHESGDAARDDSRHEIEELKMTIGFISKKVGRLEKRFEEASEDINHLKDAYELVRESLRRSALFKGEIMTPVPYLACPRNAYMN